MWTRLEWGVLITIFYIFKLTFIRKQTSPIVTGITISNIGSCSTYFPNNSARCTCFLMCACKPSTPYNLNTNHIFSALNLRPKGICQCCNKQTRHVCRKKKIKKTHPCKILYWRYFEFIRVVGIQ